VRSLLGTSQLEIKSVSPYNTILCKWMQLAWNEFIGFVTKFVISVNKITWFREGYDVITFHLQDNNFPVALGV